MHTLVQFSFLTCRLSTAGGLPIRAVLLRWRRASLCSTAHFSEGCRMRRTRKGGTVSGGVRCHGLKNLCGSCKQPHAPFSNALAKELHFSLNISTSTGTKPGGRRLTAINTRRLTDLGSSLEEASRIPSYSSILSRFFWYRSSMMSFACNSCTNCGKITRTAALSTSATFSISAMLCDQGSPLWVHSAKQLLFM